MSQASLLHPTRSWWMGGIFLIGMVALLVVANSALTWAQSTVDETSVPEAVAAFDGPTTSSPITLSQDKAFAWVVNPDDGSVSVLGDLDSNPRLLKTIQSVGKEPQAVALDTGNHAYVASPPDNGVVVIEITSKNVNTFNAVARKTLVTGAEPWNLVAAPDGQRIFVANSGQNTISVIRTSDQTVIGSVDLQKSLCNVDDQNRHFQPRGLAVTEDGKRLYVARFLSFTKPGGVQGVDGGKEGVVCQLDIPANVNSLPTAANVVRLAAMKSGFNQPDGVEAISHPNQLQSIVVYRNYVYLPNIGAASAGPDRFNSSTMAHVNVIDNAHTGTPADSPTKSINMHQGARNPEPGKKKLFFANPWAIGFRNNNGTVNAYAVSAGSDMLVKLNVDATGGLSFTVDADTTRYIDLNDPKNPATSGRSAGKNPLGIVVRNNKALVMNYISRNVSIVNLDNDTVEKVIETSALPSSNSFDEQLHVGKEVFFSSRGHFDRPGNTDPAISTDDRLSFEGWQNCASCHFAGNTDGNIWFFGSGPRKAIAMNATWSPHNPDDQRILNYSGIFDEVQDFDNNIRNTSGPLGLNVQGKPPVTCAFLPPPAAPGTVGTTAIFDPNHGLLFGDDGDINKAICNLPNLVGQANGGRPQMTVTLPGSNKAWPALDAMKEWVRFAIRTPEGALTSNEVSGGLDLNKVRQGRRLFFTMGCQSCHGGTKWSNSNKDFTSPASPDIVVTEQLTTVSGLQMIFGSLSDIGSFNLNVAGKGNTLPGQPEIGAKEVNNGNLLALGFDHNGDGKGQGYNIPALLGIFNMPPYYHNGACETLNCVLSNVRHRTAGLKAGQPDALANANNQAALVEWLKTLDADTEFPFDLSVRQHDIFVDPPVLTSGAQVVVGANIQLFGTKPDLADLLNDLGLAGVVVRFQLEPVVGQAQVDVTVPASQFQQDFGQAVISTTWQLPANYVGRARVTVTIDPDNQLFGDNKRNNQASRVLRVRQALQDTTSPVVSAVYLSDDNPFNNNDPIASTPNLKLKIVANDPAGNNGAAASGVASYCVVRYEYSQPLRRWVESKCNFAPLPAPVEADTFIVDTTLPNDLGVAYAFVWVKDNAGNISQRPGFDVITLIPSGSVSLYRNDVKVLRIPLPEGSTTLNFDVEYGDIDVKVFPDFTDPATRVCDRSANPGAVDETIVLPGKCPASPGRFQIEVKAVVNSRFKVSIAKATEAEVAAASSEPMIVVQGEDEAPVVAGPPLRAAIEEEEPVYLPLIAR